MSNPLAFSPHTAAPSLDVAVAELGASARVFAAMGPAEKAGMLRATLPLLVGTAREQVAASCAAKGIDPASPAAGEEWLSGPFGTQNLVRLLIGSLDDIARRGRPRLAGRVRTGKDGRVTVPLALCKARDRLLFRGHRADAWFAAGTTAAEVPGLQARAYQTPGGEGGVALVLGSGDVASAAVMGALTKLFVEGQVVLLKMSPVNAYLGQQTRGGIARIGRVHFHDFERNKRA